MTSRSLVALLLVAACSDGVAPPAIVRRPDLSVPTLAAATTIALVQESAWATKAPMPTPRTIHVAAAVSGKLYATGGGYNLTVEEYNPATDSWATRTSMPGPARNQFAGGVVNAKIYVVGGVTLGGAALSTVQEYDPATDTWTAKAGMPTPRWGLGVAVVNNELYAIGGTNGFTFTPIIEKYSPVSDTWATIAGSEMPTPRQDFAVAVLDGKIFTMGGYISHFVTVEAYDPATNTWSFKASLPTGKYYLGAASVGGRIFVFGGSPDGTNTLAENHVYDPGTNTWSVETSMPTARAGVGVGVIGNDIHTLGGTPDMVTAVGTHEVFTPFVTLAQAVQNVLTSIGSLGLPAGVANSLSATLKNLNTSNVSVACGKLTAFTSQVNAKVQNGQLAASAGSQLLEAAQAVVLRLGCT
jgi:N-acetylneuraminic acid mutarotase